MIWQSHVFGSSLVLSVICEVVFKASATSVEYALITTKKPRKFIEVTVNDPEISVTIIEAEFEASDLADAEVKTKQEVNAVKVALGQGGQGHCHGATLPVPEFKTPSCSLKSKSETDAECTMRIPVPITVILPKWKNLDKMCEAVKKEWNRFAKELKEHEDTHVQDERNVWNKARDRMRKVRAKKVEELFDKLEKIFDWAIKESDAQYERTENRIGQPKLNTGIECP